MGGPRGSIPGSRSMGYGALAPPERGGQPGAGRSLPRRPRWRATAPPRWTFRQAAVRVARVGRVELRQRHAQPRKGGLVLLQSVHSGGGTAIERRTARLPSANLATSDAPGDARSIRPSAVQAAACSEPRGRRAANGQITCVSSGSPRLATAKRPSLVGQSTPLLRDEEQHRASAHPLVGALGGHLPDHLCDSVFRCWSSASRLAKAMRMLNKRGTVVISASSSRGLPPRFCEWRDTEVTLGL